jgi:hypothetical protein
MRMLLGRVSAEREHVAERNVDLERLAVYFV